jgi:hypothetical protein
MITHSTKQSSRESAGSMTFKEGDGPIMRMVSCGDFMEVYKRNATFQVKTPDAIDPQKTNPNAPWTATHFPDIGCAHPIVARLMIGTDDMVKQALFKNETNKDAITLHAQQLKELLLACDAIAVRINADVEKIIAQVKAAGVKSDNHGRAINPLPQVPNLPVDCQTFLNQANRAVRHISSMPTLFIELPRKDANFDRLAEHLETVVPAESRLLALVKENAPTVRRIVGLRNSDEHSDGPKTVINNVSIAADGAMWVPQWGREGTDLLDIRWEMKEIVRYLLELAETMVVLCLQESMSEKFPMVFIRNPNPDPACPIEVSMTVDFARMNIPDEMRNDMGLSLRT